MAIYDGLALIVSVDATDGIYSDTCKLCNNEGSSRQCRRDLKDVHEEADLIATLYRRFDYELIVLKNPSKVELEDTWRICEEKLEMSNACVSAGSGELKKAFFFAFIGHGQQTGQSLSCVLSDRTTFPMEAKCKALSAQTPVIAFFNCTRKSIAPYESALTSNDVVLVG